MSNTDEIIEYKIILMGNTAVGKTSLFKKITTGLFTEKNISTIGMDKRRLSFQVERTNNNKKIIKNIEVSLVDTAGQEKFKAITKNYVKGADGIVLLYDVTNQESFDQVENWIDNIHESLGDHINSKYIIILLGNKIDLVSDKTKERNVTVEDAEKKCKDKNIIWGGECSVKDFTEKDLKKMFQNYVEKVYDKVGDKYIKKQTVNVIATVKKRKKRFRFCDL